MSSLRSKRPLSVSSITTLLEAEIPYFAANALGIVSVTEPEFIQGLTISLNVNLKDFKYQKGKNYH